LVLKGIFLAFSIMVELASENTSEQQRLLREIAETLQQIPSLISGNADAEAARAAFCLPLKGADGEDDQFKLWPRCRTVIERDPCAKFLDRDLLVKSLRCLNSNSLRHGGDWPGWILWSKSMVKAYLVPEGQPWDAILAKLGCAEAGLRELATEQGITLGTVKLGDPLNYTIFPKIGPDPDLSSSVCDCNVEWAAFNFGHNHPSFLRALERFKGKGAKILEAVSNDEESVNIEVARILAMEKGGKKIRCHPDIREEARQSIQHINLEVITAVHTWALKVDGGDFAQKWAFEKRRI